MAKNAPKNTPKKKSVSRSTELQNFKLGESETNYPVTYDPGLLEAFQNKNPGARAWTTLVCTEFTSLCPKTGQPDFARIFINYVAADKMVESKSLKLYLFSFRNHGDFHEDCVQTICDDLFALMKPHYLEVIGEFTPRGGIAIYPYAAKAGPGPENKRLQEERYARYSPGTYTMPLSRVY